MVHLQDPKNTSAKLALCGDSQPMALTSEVSAVDCPSCALIESAAPDAEDGVSDLLAEIRESAVRATAQTLRKIATYIETGTPTDTSTRQALQVVRVQAQGTQRLLAALAANGGPAAGARRRVPFPLVPNGGPQEQLAVGINAVAQAHGIQALSQAYAAVRTAGDTVMAGRLRAQLDSALPALPLAPGPEDQPGDEANNTPYEEA